jgi:hypothetical protein
LLFAAVDDAIEKGAGGDDHGSGVDHAAIAQAHAGHSPRIADLLHFEVHHLSLLDEEIRLALQDLAHLHAVEGLVALRARGPDGWAARGVEQAELNAAGVGDLAHDSAQRVDLADEVSLGDAADGGVAAHLRDEVEVQGEEGRAQPHARGGHGRLAPGVPGADYHHIELLGKRHPSILCVQSHLLEAPRV